MMCDTNWCTFCDSAISPYSDSLYCSEDCLRQDALIHHPMLGYDYADLKGFPHHNSQQHQQQQKPQHNRKETMMPSLVRKKSSIPSMLNNISTSSNSEYFSQLQKIPSLSPSLSSSVSSYNSVSNNDTIKDTTSYFQPKPRKISASSVPFMEHLNQALLRT